MLTQKQSELLRFIHSRTSRGQIVPSYDEMKDALGLQSKSGIHRLVTSLEERGFIRRLPNRARAIEVLREPAAVVPLLPGPAKPAHAGGFVGVPMMGRIAAGTPVSAIQVKGRTIDIASDLLTPGEHYALEVRGDSMVGVGIFDGDIAVIRRQETADAGQIVVALIDGEEATLKRFRRRGSSVALEAANPAYETRVLSAERVRVQGKLATIIRRY